MNNAASQIKLEVFSDYLCPWCHLAGRRLEIMQREFGAALQLQYKSYLLRPRPENRPRDPARFAQYTQGWRRMAAEEDAPRFQPWSAAAAAAAPSHSVPAHAAAKAAAALGADAFAQMHARLLRAYFEEQRDISAAQTLAQIWREAGLPPAAFPHPKSAAAAELRRAVFAQHAEAAELGITGVPAVRIPETPAFILGAQPAAVYRRWFARLLENALR